MNSIVSAYLAETFFHEYQDLRNQLMEILGELPPWPGKNAPAAKSPAKQRVTRPAPKAPRSVRLKPRPAT